MKAIRLRHPFGLEYFEHVDIADPGPLAAGFATTPGDGMTAMLAR